MTEEKSQTAPGEISAEQWKKIDELIAAIGNGKNWIIGVLVAIVTNIVVTLMKL